MENDITEIYRPFPSIYYILVLFGYYINHSRRPLLGYA